MEEQTDIETPEQENIEVLRYPGNYITKDRLFK